MNFKNFKNHLLDNMLIQAKNYEHGKNIIAFYKSLGVDTHLTGCNTLEGGSLNTYYGFINGIFDTYGLKDLKNSGSSVKSLREVADIMEKFTIQDFLDGKVAIEYEHSKCKEISELLFKCNNENTLPSTTGFALNYYFIENGNNGKYHYDNSKEYVISKGYRIVRIDMLKPISLEKESTEPILDDATFQYINRASLISFYEDVCDEWKRKIEKLINENSIFATEIKVPDTLLFEAFIQPDEKMHQRLLKYFNKPENIISSKDLQMGEILEVAPVYTKHIERYGKYLVRSINMLYSLTDPSTWSTGFNIMGRRMVFREIFIFSSTGADIG